MREGEIMDFRNMTAALLLAAGMMLTLLPANAHVFELSGAWASHDDLCKLVFIGKGSEVVFAELSDLYGSGFVIDGDRVKGKATQCTIESKKQDGDTIELSAGIDRRRVGLCADGARKIRIKSRGGHARSAL
jgi:hypothetical protein